MKLYEIPNNSKLRLSLSDGNTETTEICTFDRIDGAYSHITTPNGDVVHLSASAELMETDGVYELAEVK